MGPLAKWEFRFLFLQISILQRASSGNSQGCSNTIGTFAMGGCLFIFWNTNTEIVLADRKAMYLLLQVRTEEQVLATLMFSRLVVTAGEKDGATARHAGLFLQFMQCKCVHDGKS